MKIDYKELKNKSLFLFSDGRKPKNDEELVDMIKYCLNAIGRGQETRKENTAGELWGLEALNEIMDCVVLKNE